MYKPQPGDVLLCFAPSLIGRAIDSIEALGLVREGKRPPRLTPLYSHACIYVGNGQVVEALGRGVVRSDAHKYDGVADIWARQMTREDRQAVVSRANTMVRARVKYSYMDILVQCIGLLTGLYLPMRLKRSVVCSVAAYDCYEAPNPSIPIAERRNCAPESIAVYGALDYRGIFRG